MNAESLKRVLMELKGAAREMRKQELGRKFSPKSASIKVEGKPELDALAKSQDEAVEDAELPDMEQEQDEKPESEHHSFDVEKLAKSQDEAVAKAKLPDEEDPDLKRILAKLSMMK